MKLTRCSGGHFYDADKYSECPQCADSTIPVSAPDRFEEDVTVPLNSNSNFNNSVTDDIDERTLPITDIILGGSLNVSENADDKTVSFYEPITPKPSEPAGKTDTPAVGWMICIEGKYAGCDFRLHVGKNTIGRKDTNSICLSGDVSISREPQVIVVYEPITNRFFAIPGSANELAYVNDEVLLERVAIQKNDIIEIGSTKLMLIPCCDEKFSWNDVLKR